MLTVPSAFRCLFDLRRIEPLAEVLIGTVHYLQARGGRPRALQGGGSAAAA